MVVPSQQRDWGQTGHSWWRIAYWSKAYEGLIHIFNFLPARFQPAQLGSQLTRCWRRRCMRLLQLAWGGCRGGCMLLQQVQQLSPKHRSVDGTGGLEGIQDTLALQLGAQHITVGHDACH